MPDHSPARARESVEKLKKCGKGEHFVGPKVKHHRKTEKNIIFLYWWEMWKAGWRGRENVEAWKILASEYHLIFQFV